MLTIVTAFPWEAAAFASRLHDRRRAEIGDGAWALWGRRGALHLRLIVSGPGEPRAATAAAALAQLDPPASGILTTGVAGGLDPALAPGTLVLATRVQHRRARGGRRGMPIAATPRFRSWLEVSLRQAGLRVAAGETLTRDTLLLTPAEKAAAHNESRPISVEMEDYVWAEHAAAANLPFASLRAVLDPASASLPPEVKRWAATAPSPAGLLSALARRPSLAVTLPRLAWQRRAAVRAIDRALEAIVSAGVPPVTAPGAGPSRTGTPGERSR